MLRDDFLQDKLYKNLNIHIKTFLPLIWIIYFGQIIQAGQQDRSNIRSAQLLLPFILTRQVIVIFGLFLGDLGENFAFRGAFRIFWPPSHQRESRKDKDFLVEVNFQEFYPAMY